jgi:hypothetical protein
MKEKTDINRYEGEEFLSTYPIDTYLFYMVNMFFFIYFLIY